MCQGCVLNFSDGGAGSKNVVPNFTLWLLRRGANVDNLQRGQGAATDNSECRSRSRDGETAKRNPRRRIRAATENTKPQRRRFGFAVSALRLWLRGLNSTASAPRLRLYGFGFAASTSQFQFDDDDNDSNGNGPAHETDS